MFQKPHDSHIKTFSYNQTEKKNTQTYTLIFLSDEGKAEYQRRLLEIFRDEGSELLTEAMLNQREASRSARPPSPSTTVQTPERREREIEREGYRRSPSTPPQDRVPRALFA